MSSNVMNRQKSVQYQKTIIEFAAKEDGYFFVVSHDQNLVKSFRNVLNKEMVIGTDRIRTLPDETQFMQEVKSQNLRDKKMLVIIERVLAGKSTLPFIKQAKGLFADFRAIVLTSEVERQLLVLFHEAGAESFITRPFSMETLLEKMAFALKPQSKIGLFIDRAKDYLNRGKHQEVLDLCDKILEMKPGSAAALMLKGDVFKAMGRTDEAVTAYSQAAEGAAMYLEPLKKLAAVHKETGNFKEQLVFLEKLDRLSPLNVERKIDMGEIHMTFGDAERAEELFSQAIKNATSEALNLIEETKRAIAERCIDKNPELSERFFRSILEDKKDNYKKGDVEIFNRLGIALRRQGKSPQAAQEYEKALKISPRDENIHFNLAMAQTDCRNFRLAMANIDEVLKINPEFYSQSAGLCFNIGIIYYNGQEYERATFFLKKVLELNPSHMEAQKALYNISKGGK